MLNVLNKTVKHVKSKFFDYKIFGLAKSGRSGGIIKFDDISLKYLDALSFYHEYNDIFKHQIYNFISSKDSPLIIDAGSCIGMSILYFKKRYPNSRIIGFEPDPQVFSCLKENIGRNKLINVDVLNYGVGLNSGQIVFYADGSDGGSRFGEGNNKTSVSIVKLSDYITEPVDLIKMNIEGMEGEVIEELEPKMHLVNEFIIEYHAFSSLPQTLGNILNIFDKHGFKYFVAPVSHGEPACPFNPEKSCKRFNMIYAKKIN